MWNVARYTAEDWVRLGDVIQMRRVTKGHRQQDIADAAGLSVNTISSLENGRPGRLINLPRVARALGWTEDSCLRVLDGREPVVADVADLAPVRDDFLFERPGDISDGDWAELREELARQAQNFLRWRGDRS